MVAAGVPTPPRRPPRPRPPRPPPMVAVAAVAARRRPGPRRRAPQTTAPQVTTPQTTSPQTTAPPPRAANDRAAADEPAHDGRRRPHGRRLTSRRAPLRHLGALRPVSRSGHADPGSRGCPAQMLAPRRTRRAARLTPLRGNNRRRGGGRARHRAETQRWNTPIPRRSSFGAASAGSVGHGRRSPRRRVDRLHRHAQGQGRPGGAQRRRQDQLVHGARRAGRAVRRQGGPQGRLRLPAAGPRTGPDADGRAAVSHVLSGRRIDTEIERIEKLRIAMEERRRRADREPLRRAEEAFAANGGYAAESEARAIGAGLGLGGDRLDRPVGVLSGGERRRVELARILFAGSDVLCLDEPTNHLDIDAKEWLLGFLRSYRGALLVISHDLELLDEAITARPPPRSTDRGGRRPHHRVQRARTRQYIAGARTRTRQRLAKLAAPSPRRSSACSRSSTASERRRPRRRWPTTWRSASPGSKPSGWTADAPAKTFRVRFPVPPPAGRTVITAGGLTKSYGGPDVFSDVAFDLGRSERLLRARAERGRQDQPAAHPRRRGGPPILATFAFGHQVVAGYYAQEHDNLRPPRRCSTNIRDEVPAGSPHRDPAARPAGHDRAQRREGVPGQRHAVGRREDQAGARDADGRAQQPAAARRADQQPRPVQSRGRGRPRSPIGRKGAIIVVSHDTEFVERLAPTKVLLMPDGDVDYFNDDWLELVSLA